MAPAARDRPRAGGRLRQLTPAGRPPDRLEIDPPGHLGAARPYPDPPAGPRPAAAGPPARPVLATGQRPPLRLGGLRAGGRGYVRAAAGRAGLVRARRA